MSQEEGKRIAHVVRETRETRVEVELSVDGAGAIDCDIGDDFLRHMVETLARYSEVDLVVTARGDIAHHLVEDVAITLGRAYREAIGDAAIRRMANAVVPMDEALVQATVDLIDRPFVHIDIPDEMYTHFVRSFAMELRATIHTVVLRGNDDHHIIEATFKALGRALGEAMAPAGRTLSTKSSVKWEVR
ncbi:MAG: imidazoleglycerol-phosphate dehydratase [Methanobacteriota archaeon]|nr:MAG: imidazoleglycerol-phosphate dehydratase [Euryarchaeota archaeon]